MSLTYVQDITLDIYKDTYFRNVYTKQYDNNARILRITLTADGKLIIPGEGVRAVFRAKKPPDPANSSRGETYILNSATIDEEGKILVTLTSQTLAVTGVINCEVSLVQNEDVVSTATFRILNNESNLKSDMVNEDEFLILIEAIELAEQAINEAKTASDDIAKMIEEAEAAVADLRGPIINDETHTWWVWDTELHAYKDTGVKTSILIDENSGKVVRIWFGTVEEYNALSQIDSDVYYNILEGEP